MTQELKIEESSFNAFIKRNLLLMELFLVKLLKDRKTYLLLLLSLIPVILFLPFFPIWDEVRSGSVINIDYVVSNFNFGGLFPFIIIPPISIIFGISAISDERENKTLTQLNARPLGRQEIIFSKFITHSLIASIVIVFINTVAFLLAWNFSTALDTSKIIELYIGSSLFLILNIIVFVAIFIMIGTIIEKGALIIGFFIAYFESFFGQLIFGASDTGEASIYSISNHLYYVSYEYLLNYETNKLIIADLEPIYSLLILIGIIIVSLGIAMIAIRKMDIK